MLATINNIFLLAWTENSIYEFKSKDNKEYYSKSLENFTVMLLLICSIILPAVKVYFEIFINEQYRQAIGLVPIMFLAMIFNALSSFLGTIYTASMKTKDAFFTTIVAALSNIIVCFILIPIFNIYGYALANLISYIIFYVVRRKSVRKILEIKENFKGYIVPGFIFVLTSIIYYFTSHMFNIFYEIIIAIIILMVYFRKFKTYLIKNKK